MRKVIFFCATLLVAGISSAEYKQWAPTQQADTSNSPAWTPSAPGSSTYQKWTPKPKGSSEYKQWAPSSTAAAPPSTHTYQGGDSAGEVKKSYNQHVGPNYGTGEAANSSISPLMGAGQLKTLDGQAKGNAYFATPSSNPILTIGVKPMMATGDLEKLFILQDFDMDGTPDNVVSTPAAESDGLTRGVSGMCANGIIACQPGTYSNCKYYTWDFDAAGKMTAVPGDVKLMSQCFCFNNHCSRLTNSAMLNISTIVRDIGAFIMQRFVENQPQYIVAGGSQKNDFSIEYFAQKQRDVSKVAGFTAPKGTGDYADIPITSNATPADVASYQDYGTFQAQGNAELDRQKADPGSMYNLITANAKFSQLSCYKKRDISLYFKTKYCEEKIIPPNTMTSGTGSLSTTQWVQVEQTPDILYGLSVPKGTGYGQNDCKCKGVDEQVVVKDGKKYCIPLEGLKIGGDGVSVPNEVYIAANNAALQMQEAPPLAPQFYTIEADGTYGNTHGPGDYEVDVEQGGGLISFNITEQGYTKAAAIMNTNFSTDSTAKQAFEYAMLAQVSYVKGIHYATTGGVAQGIVDPLYSGIQQAIEAKEGLAITPVSSPPLSAITAVDATYIENMGIYAHYDGTSASNFRDHKRCCGMFNSGEDYCRYDKTAYYYYCEHSVEYYREIAVDTCIDLEKRTEKGECKLQDESIDNRASFRNFMPTGFRMTPVLRSFSGTLRSYDILRDWWDIKRTYRCDIEENDYLGMVNAFKEKAGAIESSAVLNEGSPVSMTYDDGTGSKTYMLMGQRNAGECEPACKVKIPRREVKATAGAPMVDKKTEAGVQKEAFYYDIIPCDTTSGDTPVCPVDTAAGQTVVTECGCLDNDVYEIITNFRAIQEATNDTICSSTKP